METHEALDLATPYIDHREFWEPTLPQVVEWNELVKRLRDYGLLMGAPKDRSFGLDIVGAPQVWCLVRNSAICNHKGFEKAWKAGDIRKLRSMIQTQQARFIGQMTQCALNLK